MAIKKVCKLLLTSIIQGTTIVDNLLNSDDVHYMLGALKTLGLRVQDNSEIKQAIVEGCGGQFPVGKESNKDIQLFLGNAGTAMRPLTAAVTAAGGNSRSFTFPRSYPVYKLYLPFFAEFWDVFFSTYKILYGFSYYVV